VEKVSLLFMLLLLLLLLLAVKQSDKKDRIKAKLPHAVLQCYIGFSTLELHA